MNESLIISWIALALALAIDSFNLYLIVRLFRWSQGAVDDIISEATTEIMKRLNLQVGKSGSTLEKLAGKFEESLESANSQVPDSLKPLNLPLLFARIQSGQMDFKDFLPLAAKFLSSGNRGESSGNSSGTWK